MFAFSYMHLECLGKNTLLPCYVGLTSEVTGRDCPKILIIPTGGFDCVKLRGPKGCLSHGDLTIHVTA